ncbi:ATP-dependent helicase [Candidatus Woesearchaeota archaeon]|nr:ATP-dependent helicase [Candidatus Woesearchaeota archaeon]
MISVKEKPDTAEAIDRILTETVKKWFYSRFPSYSLPQLYGVLEIHSRNNILISAPTGATKTLTGFLSILNELVDSAEKGILKDKTYAIYVSPLKALNMDIEVNLKEPLEQMEKIAGRSLGIRVAVRTGDTTASEKSKMLKKPPHILITTPESLAIVLSSYKFIEHLREVEWVIIDEVHALAENKRGTHLALSLERLQAISPAMCRIGLSATIAPIEEVAQFLAGLEGGKPRGCMIVEAEFLKKMDLKVLSPVPDLIDTEHQKMHGAMYELIDSLIQSHRSTLIFTNTRSATERVIHHLKEKYPKNYLTEEQTIGAHHGSLSKEHRHKLEESLRQGKLKAAVSSTSLELGIDIGYIDLVILLGSPKSVARAIQRIGRSGHKMHETAKGRIIVLDRDDLVECSVLLKSATEKKIDRIHIPANCLDVLAQQIYGIAISGKTGDKELYELLKKAYPYRNLQYKDYKDVLDYLSGKYISLEDRSIYAKIWHDEQTGMIGRKGRMSRVIYMTNIGTIPDESYVTVKIGEQPIGKIDEGFLEKLKRGDVFVLGGEKYEFLFSRGMVANVKSAVSKAPTIPSWFSEMLPLSYDLALEIGRFRRLMEEKFLHNRSKEEIMEFVHESLYVDENAANSIYEYFREQFLYAAIPHDRKIVIETYADRHGSHAVFHTLFGRRVNDCLSRAVAFAIGRTQHKDVEIAINDNGFCLTYGKGVNVLGAFSLLRPDKLDMVMNTALDKTEVLRRRFRHCAGRALMILREYMGRRKMVGRQQTSSMILMSAVKRISNDFPILKEARREVLEDLMDIENTRQVLQMIQEGRIKIKHINTAMPSPFAFSIALQGYTDIMKIEDRAEFLKRMHQAVLARIAKS